MHYTGAAAEEVAPLIMAHHYSRRMPGSIQHIYVAREDGGLFGDFGNVRAASIWSSPPTRWGEPVLELTRLVRDPVHTVPLSQLLAFSCAQLKAQGYPLLVSFADWTQRHHGGIYQAAGWNYAGRRDRTIDGVLIDGTFKPGRSCNAKWGTRSPDKLREILRGKDVQPHYDEGKYLYWRALSVAGKTRAKRLGLARLPYPKPNNAVGPLDEPVPAGVRRAQPPETAPNASGGA